MIKLIIFDMDGVLIDAKEIHYIALNKALATIGDEYIIKRDEHLSTYDGLPTTKKLNLLHQNKNLPKNTFDKVWRRKQEATEKEIHSMSIDIDKMYMLKNLKKEGYQIAVATNSIRENTKLMLMKTGLMSFVDFFYSNQDVKNPKPNTEMYLKCMIKAEVNPIDTLIIEDSHIGRQTALKSGAWLLPVKDTDDTTLEKVENRIKEIDKKQSIIKPKWQGGKMNVLIPMAGAGTRFVKAGYTFPKPLIDVNGQTMIQVVVDNLNIEARHIFIVQKEHYDEFNLKPLLNVIAPGCEIIQIDSITEGAACTALLAKDLIDNDEPLLIANSDQWIDWDSNNFLYAMTNDDIDGGILTFESNHPKWSYAELNDSGFVNRVAEKEVISNHATVGIYYYKKGSEYVKYAEQMIEKNIRVNNEFYVCPVYNEYIADDKKIKIFPVDKMMGLGTPEDLNKFLKGDWQ